MTNWIKKDATLFLLFPFSFACLALFPTISFSPESVFVLALLLAVPVCMRRSLTEQHKCIECREQNLILEILSKETWNSKRVSHLLSFSYYFHFNFFLSQRSSCFGCLPTSWSFFFKSTPGTREKNCTTLFMEMIRQNEICFLRLNHNKCAVLKFPMDNLTRDVDVTKILMTIYFSIRAR